MPGFDRYAGRPYPPPPEPDPAKCPKCGRFTAEYQKETRRWECKCGWSG